MRHPCALLWIRRTNSTVQEPKFEVTQERKQSRRISPRDFFVYLGAALIIPLAFLDPGCLATDIAAGAGFNYDLIWALLLASSFAILLQYLSGKLGLATGNSVSQFVGASLEDQKPHRTVLAGRGTRDRGHGPFRYLGTVIALNLLFGIPLLYRASSARPTSSFFSCWRTAASA